MLTTTEQLWEAFHLPLQQFIQRRIPDEATAEDVLQDVFLKIHQHIDTLKEVRKLDCCHFELDRRGHIIDYQRHCC